MDQEQLLKHLRTAHGRDESKNIGKGYADYLEDLHAALHRETESDRVKVRGQ